MAVGRLSRVLVVFILLALTLSSFRVKAVEAVLDRKANILLVVSGFDIKQFPTRNSVRARFYLRETRVSPSLKCAVGIRLVNIATCASCSVLLAGDVMENPGPVKDPCAVCTNGCRRNQKSIQCDLCDNWFHAKCIDMGSDEFNHLSDPSMAWQCMKCLFPGFDTPPRKNCATNTRNKNLTTSLGACLNAKLSKRGMKFAHVNIGTLPGHYAEVKVLLQKTALDVFAVTESRLDCTIPDGKVCPDGYTCFRTDRNRNGGGCAVFVKNKWPCKRRPDLESESIEMVCVEICPAKAKNTIFCEIYKPPIMNSEVFMKDFGKDVLAKLDEEINKDVIVMGDFNGDVIAAKPCKYVRKLMQETRLLGMKQLINEPTHVTDHSSTAIDLVFVNNPHRIVSHGVQDFGVGYHSIVFAVKKAGICKGTKGVREVRSYKRYNKEYFCRDVNEVPWNVIEVSKDMGGAVNAWNTLFNDVANRHAPIKKLRTKNTTKPWISDDIKELMAERDYAFKVAKRSGGEKQKWDHYRKIKNFTNRKVKSAEAEYYKNLINSANGPKDTWKALNSVLGEKSKETISQLQVQDGKVLLSEPKKVASKFNEFFASIGNKVARKLQVVAKDAWKKYESNDESDSQDKLELRQVDCRNVREILKSLKVNKAAGVDKIPAKLIRDAEAELAPYINYLVNKSIKDNVVPAQWKVARVSPLYKAEDRLQTENYRPISVLPVLSKVIERVVHTQLSTHLDNINYLYSHQYGFRRGRSTTQAIAQLNNWVLESMDEGKVTGLLFVDISKAFDSINHKVLLDKLKHMGMSERSLQWFKTYLAERRQCVFINGQTSETQRNTLGVPQGSILGPLLFNMYINSLPNAVETRLILYADDAVLVFPAATPNELQTALEREFGLMSDWYLDNRLTLNVKKTKLMLAGSKTMLARFEDFQFQSEGGASIERVGSFKYLGVTADDKWSWKVHLRSFFRKLGHRLTVFNRIRHVLDRKTRIAYFNGLVLPHLDYADIIWGDQPGLKTEMDQLQAFQNRFTKKIELKKKLSSAEVLKLLNWMPLSSRRFAHRVKLVQNSIKGEIPQHLNCFKQIANHRWELRNNYLPRLVRPKRNGEEEQHTTRP